MYTHHVRYHSACDYKRFDGCGNLVINLKKEFIALNMADKVSLDQSSLNTITIEWKTK